MQTYKGSRILTRFPPFRLQASRPRAVYASTSSSTAFQSGARQQPPTPPPLPPKPDEGGTTGDSNTNCAAGEAEAAASSAAAAPRPGPSWLQLHHEHQLLRAALAARKNRRTLRQPLMSRNHRLPIFPPDLNSLDHVCAELSNYSSSEHTHTHAYP